MSEAMDGEGAESLAGLTMRRLDVELREARARISELEKPGWHQACLSIACMLAPHVKADGIVEAVRDILNQLEEANRQLDEAKKALTTIADYDEESIWMDDRDDAANAILAIARKAIGRKELY